MLRPSPYWLTLPAALALVAAAVVAHPEPDDDSVAVPVGTEYAAESDHLDALLDASHRRKAAKEEVVAALVDGRMTLAQATAEFLRLNAESENITAYVRREFAGATDEERSARNVLHYVSIRSMPSGEKARVLAHLEREFARMYGPAAKGLPPPKAEPSR